MCSFLFMAVGYWRVALMARARLLSIPMSHLSRLDPSLSIPSLLLRLLLHVGQHGAGVLEVLLVDLGLCIEELAVLSDHE